MSRPRNNYHPKKVVQIKIPYRATKGSFGKSFYNQKRDGLLMIDDWFFCREDFFWESRTLTHFFMWGVKGRLKGVADFMKHVERKLKVSSKTQFGPTQVPQVMWIRPSPWWKSGKMKWSLYSALLRAGLQYKGDYEEALFSTQYTKKTRYAVERFMDGHTKFVGRSCLIGWMNQFFYGEEEPIWHNVRKSRVPPEKVDKMLIKP